MEDLTRSLLIEPDSPIMAPRGRRPQGCQIDYAEAILRFFSQGARHCLIEGETGTGKTLGYCVPTILWSIWTGYRVVISTHSIQLQDQVMALLDDLIPDIAQVTGLRLRHARRIGRRNHLSARVFAKWFEHNADAFTGEARHALDRIGAAFEESGFVLLQEMERILLEEDMVAPVDLAIFSIDARSDPDDPAVLAYHRMVGEARAADVVVVNHALLSLNLLVGDRILDLAGEGSEDLPGRPAVLVVDEADRLPDVAESIGTVRMNLALLEGALRQGADAVTSGEIATAVKRLRVEIDRLRERDELPLTGFSAATVGLDLSGLHWTLSARSRNRIGRMVREIARLTRMARSRADAGNEGALEVIEDLEEVEPILRQISRGEQPKGPLILYWTPIRGQPGIATQGIDAATLISRLWRRDSPVPVIFTSATLDLAQGGVSLKGFARRIGLSDAAFTEAVRARVSPEMFGAMSFRIADPRVMPRPVLRDEDENGLPPLNPAHARLCLSMVAEAARDGARVLVLVPSYRDCLLWRDLLEERPEFAALEPRMILDRRRQRNINLQRFRDDPGSILVSPGHWIGLDMPHMIRHLVFPRLPLQPPDLIRSGGYADWLRRIGRHDQARITSGAFVRMIEEAVQKMRQGLGRGIRAHDDRVTVWIGDPRWPAPAGIRAPLGFGWSQAFLRSVPERFRDDLRNARLWQPEHPEGAAGDTAALRAALQDVLDG